MGREIKFRAWDKKRKCYAKVIQTTNQGWKGYRDKTYITNGVMLFSKWVLSRFIIEQYTGLKDKNGKKICEGDIVLDYYDGDDAFIVEWDKDTASFRLTGTDNIASVSFDIFYSDKDLEVIGTIHENPELLEKGEENE